MPRESRSLRGLAATVKVGSRFESHDRGAGNGASSETSGVQGTFSPLSTPLLDHSVLIMVSITTPKCAKDCERVPH